jgi:hypothetical protein
VVVHEFVLWKTGQSGLLIGLSSKRLSATLVISLDARGESLCHRVKSVCGPRFHSSSVRASRRTVEGLAGLVLEGVRGIGEPVDEPLLNMELKKDVAAGLVGVTVAVLPGGRTKAAAVSPFLLSVGDSSMLVALGLNGTVTVYWWMWPSRFRCGRRSGS